MRPRLLVEAEAEAEIDEAFRWYEGRAAGLGSEFLRAVSAAFALMRRGVMSTFRALLESLLMRRIPPREAMRGLGEFARADFDSNPAYVEYRQSCPDDIELTPEAVLTALEAYLAGEMSAQELRDWALFITLSGAYRTPEPPPNDEDWFDPMWDAVHEVACPEVHGPISPESVREKVGTLDRFNPGTARGAV